MENNQLSPERLKAGWIRAMKESLSVNPIIDLTKYYSGIIRRYDIQPKDVDKERW